MLHIDKIIGVAPNNKPKRKKDDYEEDIEFSTKTQNAPLVKQREKTEPTEPIRSILLVLQEAGDNPSNLKECTAQEASFLLSLLKKFKERLLFGELAEEELLLVIQRIKTLNVKKADEKIFKIINEIELRAHIELAKIQNNSRNL